MQELVTQLEQQLTGDIRCNSRVVELRKVKTGYEVVVESPNFTYQTLTAEAVVLALPAYDTTPLISPFAAAVAAELRRIRYVSTTTVSLGYGQADIGHELDGFGFLIPNQSNGKFRPAPGHLPNLTIGQMKITPYYGSLSAVRGKEKLVNLSDVWLITFARMKVSPRWAFRRNLS